MDKPEEGEPPASGLFQAQEKAPTQQHGRAESSSNTEWPSSRGGRKKGKKFTDPRRKPVDPKVRRALRMQMQAQDVEHEAFPFHDPHSCYDPDEFVRENHRVIELGYSRSRTISHMCRYAAKGRMALVTLDRDLSLLVRSYDKEEGLIEHRLFSQNRASGFYCPLLVIKTANELAKESKNLRGDQGYYSCTSSSEEDEQDEDYEPDESEERGKKAEEEEEDPEKCTDFWDEDKEVWPLKELSFVKVYRNSIYARRFDSHVFDPSPEFYRAAQADPKGPKGRAYNSYRGLRWSPEDAQRIYEGWDSLQKAEADLRAEIIMDHLKLEACRGNIELLNYLLQWIASLVIHPERRMLTMLVFVGDSGCGKSVLVQNVIGPLFGSHFRYNSDLGDLLGIFNSSVEDTILAYADEARVTAGTRAAAQLKTLITESTASLRVGRKGHDTFYTDSHLSLIGAVENMAEFEVDLLSRRYIPFHFAGNKRGDKGYFARLVSAAVDDKRMGLLAFLVHLLRTVDITGFDRGQVPPTGKNEAIREIMSSEMVRDVFREWIRKIVDRGYIVPRHELDDTDIMRNEPIEWIDPHGRTYATRHEPYICEIQSEVLYARFRKDMGLARLPDSQIRMGLEGGGYLHPDCRGREIRRRPWCAEREGGKVSFVRKRKTYLTLLPCEAYEHMLGLESSIEEGQEEEQEQDPSAIAKKDKGCEKKRDPSSLPYDMTPEQDAEYNRLFSIVAAQEAAGQQEAALRSSSSPSSRAAAAQKDSRPRDKGKEKVDRRLPDRATFPQNDVYDEDHAADMQALLLYEAEEEERERRRRSSSEKRRRSPEPSSPSSSTPDPDVGSDSTTATATSHTEGQQQQKEVALLHASRRPRKKPRLSRKRISALVDVLLSLATDEGDADPSDGEDEIDGNNRSS